MLVGMTTGQVMLVGMTTWAGMLVAMTTGGDARSGLGMTNPGRTTLVGMTSPFYGVISARTASGETSTCGAKRSLAA